MKRTLIAQVAKGLLYLFYAGMATPVWSAAPVVDPIARPALNSPLANHGVVTAITRNGASLIAVGERGHILLSDDSGLTWTQAQVPVSVTLTAVTFVDASDGWACGHGSVILHTQDGGRTWTKQLDGHLAAAIMRAAPQTPSASAARTAAGLGEDQSDKPLLDVHFDDPLHGWAIGAYGLAFLTNDGGRNWSLGFDRIPNPDGKHLYAMRRVGSTLAIVGEQGGLYLSRDGGRSFSAVAVPYKGSFFDLVPLGERQFLIVGLRGNAYRTDNGGASWTKVATASKDALTSGITLADGTVLLVDGAGNIWRSTDHGTSFSGGRIPDPFPLSGIAQGPDASLAVVGARGIEILPLSAIAATRQP